MWTVSYMARVNTYPVGNYRATRLFYGDLGKWADQIWPSPEELRQSPLTHSSTQCLNDLLTIQVPLADRLDFYLTSHFCTFEFRHLCLFAFEMNYNIY